MVNNIPVGIYDGEIFIARIEDGKIAGFNVLRPVSKEQLSSLRDKWERIDDYRYYWKEAVAADETEQGFDDWFEDAWEEEFDESDPEDFPGKDTYYLDFLWEEDREAADAFMKEQGEDVGTWEDSGWYSPVKSWSKDKKVWHGWDLVFDREECRHWAEVYDKEVREN
jgi:hypothetical protein